MSVHVIPAAGVQAEVSLGAKGGSGLATAALQTAERLAADGRADLVLVAVEPGHGDRVAAALNEGR